MATLYVTEYQGLSTAYNDTAQAVPGTPVAIQTVAISGAAASSAPFNANTTLVRLHTDSICSFTMGSAPVATTSCPRMAANQTEYFGVRPGQTVSVIANT